MGKDRKDPERKEVGQVLILVLVDLGGKAWQKELYTLWWSGVLILVLVDLGGKASGKNYE